MCERPDLNEGGEGSSPNSLYAGLFLSVFGMPGPGLWSTTLAVS